MTWRKHYKLFTRRERILAWCSSRYRHLKKILYRRKKDIYYKLKYGWDWETIVILSVWLGMITLILTIILGGG